MPEARVARYWSQKTHESRLLDLYYSLRQGQSTRVASREALLRDIEELRQEHPTADAVPRPEALRGVYLRPERIEIWRGSPDRLHDRRLFERADDGGGWRQSVLVP
jgi:pyridoxamine 5'-phosphate oxidase